MMQTRVSLDRHVKDRGVLLCSVVDGLFDKRSMAVHTSVNGRLLAGNDWTRQAHNTPALQASSGFLLDFLNFPGPRECPAVRCARSSRVSLHNAPHVRDFRVRLNTSFSYLDIGGKCKYRMTKCDIQFIIEINLVLGITHVCVLELIRWECLDCGKVSKFLYL